MFIITSVFCLILGIVCFINYAQLLDMINSQGILKPLGDITGLNKYLTNVANVFLILGIFFVLLCISFIFIQANLKEHTEDISGFTKELANGVYPAINKNAAFSKSIKDEVSDNLQKSVEKLSQDFQELEKKYITTNAELQVLKLFLDKKHK